MFTCIVLIILILTRLVSCYRSHNIYIKNVSRDIIYLNTEKAIVSNLAIKRSSLYDSIIAIKIKFLFKWCIENRFKSIYFFLFGGIGKKPSGRYFPLNETNEFGLFSK